MRTVSRRLLAQTFVDELLKAPEPEAKHYVVQSLAAFLIESKWVKELDMIVADIIKELAARGHVAASVITARELSDDARTAITELVQLATKAGIIELSEIINPDLVGGVKLTIPGRELDTSVKRQLQQLKTR